MMRNSKRYHGGMFTAAYGGTCAIWREMRTAPTPDRRRRPRKIYPSDAWTLVGRYSTYADNNWLCWGKLRKGCFWGGKMACIEDAVAKHLPRVVVVREQGAAGSSMRHHYHSKRVAVVAPAVQRVGCAQTPKWTRRRVMCHNTKSVHSPPRPYDTAAANVLLVITFPVATPLLPSKRQACKRSASF